MLSTKSASVLLATLLASTNIFVAAQFDLDTLPRCVTACISEVISSSGCSIDNPPCVCVNPAFFTCQVKGCPAEVQNSQTVEKVTAWCNSGNSTSTTSRSGTASPSSGGVSSTRNSISILTSTVVTNSGSPSSAVVVPSSSSVSSARPTTSPSSLSTRPASSAPLTSASSTPTTSTTSGAKEVARAGLGVVGVTVAVVGVVGGLLSTVGI